MHALSPGTEAGEKHIPESLGLAPGLVFLICLIVFQQLQYYDFGAISEWVFRSSHDGALEWVSGLIFLESSILGASACCSFTKCRTCHTYFSSSLPSSVVLLSCHAVL